MASRTASIWLAGVEAPAVMPMTSAPSNHSGEKLVRTLDVVRGRAEPAGDLCQARGVGRVPTAYDHHHIRSRGELGAGALVPRGRLADGVEHAKLLGAQQQCRDDLG